MLGWLNNEFNRTAEEDKYKEKVEKNTINQTYKVMDKVSPLILTDFCFLNLTNQMIEVKTLGMPIQ